MAAQSTKPPTEWVGVSDAGRKLEIIASVFISLAAVAVILRLFARLTSIRKLLPDDYLCIFCQILAFGLLADIIILVRSCGMGWHITEIPTAQILKFFKVYTAGEVLYTTIIVFYKLAGLFLYRSIFGDMKQFNIAFWILVGVCIAWYISAIVSTFLQCTPVEKLWNPTVRGTCINQDAYILGHSLINMALDFIILLLPLPWIWRLHLGAKKKIALSAMFLIGGVVCVASIIRLVSSYPIDFTDPTYGLIAVTTWSQIEPAIGIIAACLPTLRQLLFRSLPSRSRASPDRKYASKSDQESTNKSHTAIALTGWKSNEAYTEVGSFMEAPKSRSGRPDLEANSSSESNEPASFLDIDPIGRAIGGDEADSNSIFVKKEVSVYTK